MSDQANSFSGSLNLPYMNAVLSIIWLISLQGISFAGENLMKHVDGYIAQVWTGTSHEPT